MVLQNLHHVAIIASDYEKSKDFYVNKLGEVEKFLLVYRSV